MAFLVKTYQPFDDIVLLMALPRYEFRSVSAGFTSSRPVEPPWEADPFRYGHRWVRSVEGRYEMVPLSYEDLLDPQEDDFVTDDNLNRKLAALLTYLFEQRFADEPDVAVWSDFKLRFGDKGKGPGPDVCVLRGVREPARRRGSFWVGREPGDLVLVIEIVSRRYRKKDYKDSKAVYEREKVPELILIELQGEYLAGPYELSGFKLDAKGVYQEMSVDEGGGLVSEETGVRLAKDPQGWGLEVTDVRTGQRLLTPEEVAALAEQEAARAEREAERAKQEAARAEQEAVRAEQEAVRAEQEAVRAEREAAARRALEEELARLKRSMT